MEWHHNLAEEENIRNLAIGRESNAASVLRCRGCDLVNVLEHGCTMNSVSYVSTLRELKARLQRVPPTRAMVWIFFFFKIMQDHTLIVNIGWEVLFRPLYIPNLASSDFYLYWSLKETHRGVYFEDNDVLKRLVPQWLKKQVHEFYQTGKHGLLKRRAETMTEIILKVTN